MSTMLRCQICVKLGGRIVVYPNLLDDLKIHSEVHQIQIDDNTIEADQRIFDTCFPDFVDKVDQSGQENPVVTASVTEMAGEVITTNNRETPEVGNDSIEGLCRAIVNRCPQDRIRCLLCDHNLQTCLSRGNARRFDTILNHALLHLNKLLYSCRHCQHQSITPSGIRSHLSKKHDLLYRPANYIDDTKKREGEIIDILNQCFKNNQQREEGTHSIIERTQTHRLKLQKQKNDQRRKEKAHSNKRTQTNSLKLRKQKIDQQREKRKRTRSDDRAQKLCLKLCKEFGKERKIICNKCRKSLVAEQRKQSIFRWDTSIAVNHATSLHLKKPIYSCKYCKYSCGGRNFIKEHLKKIHRLPQLGNYIDNSDQYVDDLIKIISECYDQDLKIPKQESLSVSDEPSTSGAFVRIVGE